MLKDYISNMKNFPKKESAIVEFKASFNEDVIETLVAFANTKGGTVYVGVSDKGKVQGITIGKESIQNWINEIKNKTSPQIVPDAEILIQEDKTILALFVSEYPIKPVLLRGKFFKRAGNSNHLLNTDEIANEHLKTINSSWDMYPDLIHSLDDISLNKVQKSIKILKNNGITINESAASFLSKYDLLRDGRLTNAAYLMFKNKDSVITTIELGRFQDQITIKDTARTKSDILQQVDEVLNYVKKHINIEVIITGNARNTQKWQYPMEAIREIVLNMIIHRDYRSTSDSIVKIFNDKIEFYNPGRLPDTISIEDLLSNNYRSTPRNKKVAEFFKDLGLIEKYGSGIQRIIGYFKEESRPLPEFKNISDGFLVTAFAVDNKSNEEKVAETVKKSSVKSSVKSSEKSSGKSSEKSSEKSSGKSSEKIINIIKDNPHITIEEMSSLLSLSTRAIEKNISKLKAQGLIERVGADKGGCWKIKSKDL